MNRRAVLWTSALLLTAALVFGVTLPNPYYFDDWYVLRENGWLAGGVSLLHWFRSGFADRAEEFISYRPLLMMSFAANVRFLGESVESLRGVNLLLHALNAWLVARIFLLLLRGRSPDWVAWAASFFFLLHPIQTLPINFLWKRSELLSVFFVLTGLLLHIRERCREGSYRWGVIAAQGSLLMASVATKESGIVLLPLLLVTDVALGKVDRKVRSVALYLFLTAGVVFFLWFRLGVVDGWLTAHTAPITGNRRNVGAVPYFLASLDVIPKYVLLWLIPRPLLLDDPSPLTSFPWAGGAATAGLAVLSVLLGIRFRREPAVAVSLALFWVGLAPTSGLRPLFLVMDQVRLYLPLAGLSLLFALLLRGFTRRIGLRPAWLLVAVGLLYGSASFLQNLRYRSPSLIWRDVTEVYPDSGMAWEGLGMCLERVGRAAEGREALEMAALVEPDAPGYRIYAVLSRLERAGPAERKRILDGIRTSELEGRKLSNLAIWEADHGEEARAEAHFLEAARRNPSFFHAHFNLGILWERKGNLEGARRAFANALALDPKDRASQEAVKRLGPPRGD